MTSKLGIKDLRQAQGSLLNRTFRAPAQPGGAVITARSGLAAGLLDHGRDAWGLAAPTGTGKTFMARLLVLDALQSTPGSKVLYIVPTNALIHQVSEDLTESLEHAAIAVTAVRPQITALDSDETDEIAEAAVLVLTPEKADLLLRIGAEFLNNLSLIIVDEAHHIEDGTRGVLLELYLARLRSKLAENARFVLLSAVAPNISEITKWIGERPGFILLEQRSTRMKVGIYKIRKEGARNRGMIEYTDGTCVRLFEQGVERGQQAGLAQLTERLADAGPVLVVAHGKRTTEKLAEAVCERLAARGLGHLSREQLASPAMARLDSRLEREMYADVKMRELIRFGVGYHHAGLPPRVREAVEAAITEGLITVVIATTTLADGVNFPFSTVIVQSLAMKDPTFETGRRMSWRVFTPRRFWNIAGRAGRPGSDHEGQVILYEPSLMLEHAGSIDPYLQPEIREIPPVTSALASGLSDLHAQVQTGEVGLADLRKPELPEKLPRRTRGVVNLLRVGLAHARATGSHAPGDSYFDATFASRTMSGPDFDFASLLVREQDAVLAAYLSGEGAPTVELVAELGLSIDTLTRLQFWVQGMPTWQLKRMGDALYGAAINFNQLKYIIGPVLKNMAELEGRKLSGWYSTVVEDWCRGKPFSQIKPTTREPRLEDLIGLMYSQIQYILPWGLYATDRFVAEESTLRSIDYDKQVAQLAYLVDAGVPDMGALRLTSAGFERTDAARLSTEYLRSAASTSTDIIGWLRAQSRDRVAALVRGQDRRRLDYDFDRVLRDLGGPMRPAGE